jgi:DNA polymerase III delta subunit
MIVFLYGEDSFRRRKKFSEITSEFIKKNGNIGFSEFDGPEEVGKFAEVVKSRSMFSPIMLIALKNMEFKGLSTEDKKSILSALHLALSDSGTVALISSGDKSSTKDFEFLDTSPAVSQKFDFLSGEKLIFYVLKEASEKGVKLSESDAKNIIYSLDGDLWAISSELDKLAAAQITVIPERDHSFSTNYFELLNSLKSGNSIGKRIISLEIILNKLKEDPARVFNGLAYSAPRGTLPSEWFGIMADYDVAIKSGKIDYEEALLDLVIR